MYDRRTKMNKFEIVATVGSAIGIIGGISCGDGNQEVSPTPDPTGNIPASESPAPETATATLLATPEFTPGMPFTKMPKLPSGIKDWDSAVNRYYELKTDGRMTWLVDNERWSVGIDKGGGFEGSTPTALHLVLKIKPASAEDVAIIDDEACKDLKEAVSPLIPQNLERRVAVQNSQAQPGQDPLEVDLHLTHEDAQKYREKTDCEPVQTP